MHYKYIYIVRTNLYYSWFYICLNESDTFAKRIRLTVFEVVMKTIKISVRRPYIRDNVIFTILQLYEMFLVSYRRMD